MIKKASEFRAAALESLSGKWGGAVVMTLVYMVIVGVASCIPLVGSLASLLLLPLAWSLYVAFLENVRNKSGFQVGDLFKGFNDYVRILVTMLLVNVYTVLWSLLLFVPGVIKSLSYSMTGYILKDEPELSNNAAIEKSMAMMEGHKMDLFMLQLSFIGWMLLAILTLGIGVLWVVPYMSSAQAHFYEEVKAEYEGRCGCQE